MNKVFSLITLLILCLYAKAQTPSVIYSKPFEENDADGWLLQASDGRTFNGAMSDGNLQIRIFDTNHKLVVTKLNSNDLWTDRKISAASTDGVFEVDGQLVLLIEQVYRNNMLVLHRIIISSETGEIMKVDRIDTFQRHYGIFMDTYYVTHDPETHHYAVVSFQGYNKNLEQQATVRVFNTKHELIQKAAISKVKGQPFLEFQRLLMTNGNVYLFTNPYDPKRPNQKTPLLLSVLKNGSNEFETTSFDGPFKQGTHHYILYNTHRKLIQMLSKIPAGTRTSVGFSKTTETRYYNLLVTFLDPESQRIVASAPYRTPLADAYARQRLGVRDGFKGIEARTVEASDGTPAILANNEVVITKGRVTASFTDQVGFMRLNDQAEEASASIVRIPNITSNSVARRIGAGGYRYISAPSGDYIIFNDLPENFTKKEKEEPHDLFTISDANAVLARMGEDKVEKQYLFGAPEGDKARFIFTNSFDWNKSTNTLAAWMIQRDGKKKTMHVAWIKL